jgi:NADH-quinone oxidoreductase subunit L
MTRTHAHAKPAQPAAHADHSAHGHDDLHADDTHAEHHGLAPGQKPHETPWVVTLPLIMLAIPSVIIGYIGVGPMLFGDYFKSAIFVDAEAHPVMEELAHHFHGAFAMATHAVTTPVFWLAFLGVALAWFLYLKRPDIPEAIKARSGFSTRCWTTSTTSTSSTRCSLPVARACSAGVCGRVATLA